MARRSTEFSGELVEIYQAPGGEISESFAGGVEILVGQRLIIRRGSDEIGSHRVVWGVWGGEEPEQSHGLQIAHAVNHQMKLVFDGHLAFNVSAPIYPRRRR